MKNHWYHSSLRISAAVVACVLLFESGIISPLTKELAHNAGSYLANTASMSASVDPNELNVITAALTQREQELSQREAALRQREIAVDVGGGMLPGSTSTFVLSALLFILLVLIVLNYVLDYIRMREEKPYANART